MLKYFEIFQKYIIFKVHFRIVQNIKLIIPLKNDLKVIKNNKKFFVTTQNVSNTTMQIQLIPDHDHQLLVKSKFRFPNCTCIKCIQLSD